MLGLSLRIPDIAVRSGGNAPAAPTLTLTSPVTDNQPDFVVAGDLLVNDVVTISAFDDVGLTVLEGSGAGTVTIAGTLTVTNQLGPLTDGTKFYVASTARVGKSISARSNVQTNTIDTTAPILSSPTGTKTGTTTANLSVSTNEANGSLFGVVTTSATPPTKAQVKLGQDNSSVAAALAFSQAVSATGVQTKSATGLASGTTYTAHFMQEDAVGNQSNVSSSSTFVTDAAGTTLNPLDKSAGASLSPNNLTLTGSSGYQGARTVASFTGTSKKYWEVHADTVVSPAGNIVEGMANATASLTIFLGGGNFNDIGWSGAGAVFINSVQVTTIQGWAQGDTLCFAVDLANLKIWFRTNGGNWNNDILANQNPATPTGGISISTLNAGPYLAAVQADAADVLTATFSGFAFSVPSGFSAI